MDSPGSRLSKKHGPVTAVLNGAGLRGREVYGRYAVKYPNRLKFVAVAEPDPVRRRLFQKIHGISDNLAFPSWEEMMNPGLGRLADTAFICTRDDLHFRPAIRALEMGYHLVLEKPISPHLIQCQQLVSAASRNGQVVQVSHVLRFTDFWKKVKAVVASGQIGRIVHYDHSENVSYWHFGHSYVRGNYKNAAKSSPAILAKACHDLDLMFWIMGAGPLAVQSTGGLMHYRPEAAPPGAPERCTDGCPEADTCPWYAPRLYLQAEPLLRIGLHAPFKAARLAAECLLNHPGLIKVLGKLHPAFQKLVNWDEFPSTAITSDLTPEGKLKALREGPYGKCVFKSGNDVVDHQVSTFTFPGGATGTLTLHGMSDLEGREIKIVGTKGVIRGYFRLNGEEITLTDFRFSKTKVIHRAGLSLAGHGGGDKGLLDSFVAVLSGAATPAEAGTTDLAGAMESHFMAFAAEKARGSGLTLDMETFRRSGLVQQSAV